VDTTHSRPPAALDGVDLARAELGIDQPLETCAALVDGAQAAALAAQIFLGDGSKGISRLGRLLAPLGEGVAALGDASQIRPRLLARIPQGELAIERHPLAVTSVAILHDEGMVTVHSNEEIVWKAAPIYSVSQDFWW